MLGALKNATSAFCVAARLNIPSARIDATGFSAFLSSFSHVGLKGIVTFAITSFLPNALFNIFSVFFEDG